MHNSHQSFAVRQRLIDFDGDASNHVIWFSEPNGTDITELAFEVMDEWMRNIMRRPRRGVVRNKPRAATDSCFAASGDIIYRGKDAWAGILDRRREGPCTAVMPPFSTSRIVAGAPITGDIFKCHLMPVADAIAEGVYGSVQFDAAQRAALNAIFPTGVCDYSRGDARRPD